MEYHFVTHWQVRGNIDHVYKILKDGARYADWWRPATRRSEETGPNKVRSVVRARLPYTLDFTSELVREKPPHEFEIRATGDLVGRGLWRLRQIGDTTAIEFSWDVRAVKPLLRWLSPLLKPLFSWNHDWVMEGGERCLKEEMERRGDVFLVS